MAKKFPELKSQEEIDEETIADLLRKDAGLALDSTSLYAKDREARFTVEDLEFSDWGRSERFPPGWYIIPLAWLAFLTAGLLAFAWVF